MAVVSVLYCQDAIYRLNYVVPAIFSLIALHQIFAPKQKSVLDDMLSANDFFDNLKLNYDRLKTAKGFVNK
jgi:poly(A) polymerase Pap1